MLDLFLINCSKNFMTNTKAFQLDVYCPLVGTTRCRYPVGGLAIPIPLPLPVDRLTDGRLWKQWEISTKYYLFSGKISVMFPSLKLLILFVSPPDKDIIRYVPKVMVKVFVVVVDIILWMRHYFKVFCKAKNIHITRMHSSRMRTARLLTISRSIPGVRIGLANPNPHPSCIMWPVMNAGKPTPTLPPPPVDRMTNACKNMTLSQTSLSSDKHFWKTYLCCFLFRSR